MTTAKLFQNGRSQAVRLPKAYRFSGEKVIIKRFGKGVVLLPDDASWDSMIEATEKFSTDFMETRDQGGQQEREACFE
jgi:antitoxin VapB